MPRLPCEALPGALYKFLRFDFDLVLWGAGKIFWASVSSGISAVWPNEKPSVVKVH